MTRSVDVCGRDGKIQHQVWPDEGLIELQHPVQVEASGHVACQSGVQEPIGDDQMAFPQRGQDLLLHAVPEVGGVQERKLLGAETRIPFRALMTGLSSSDEFHLVVTTLYSPSAFSHVLSSLRCVVFPEPSGPSKATSSPRRFEGSPKWSRIWRSQDIVSTGLSP